MIVTTSLIIVSSMMIVIVWYLIFHGVNNGITYYTAACIFY